MHKKIRSREDATKMIAKGVFLSCIAVITFLYAQFWFGGNMVTLMKRLIPVVIISLVAGNRAL